MDFVRDKISFNKLDFDLLELENDFFEIENWLEFNAQIVKNNLKYLEKVKTNQEMMKTFKLGKTYLTMTVEVMLVGTFGYAIWVLYKMLGLRSDNYEERKTSLLARKLKRKPNAKK